MGVVEGAVSYQIYVDGKLCNSAPITSCEYTIENLSADTSYEITVSALNNKGESEKSLVKVLRTGLVEDDPDDDNNNNNDNNSNNNDNNGGGTVNASFLAGDADCSGTVNLDDAKIVLCLAVGIKPKILSQHKVRKMLTMTGQEKQI